MARVTEHIARKARSCDEYPRCEHGIRKGERYRRYVAFPGDDGHEEGTKPLVLTMCAGCAADFGVPVTGTPVEILRICRSEPRVIATGVITRSVFSFTGVESYEVTDAAGVVHEASPHRVNVLRNEEEL